MADAQNIIELGFNVEELTAQKKLVLDLMTDLFGKLEAYDGTKFNPLGNGGLADLQRSFAEGAKAMAAFQATAEKFNQVQAESVRARQQSTRATDQETQQEKIHQKTLADTVTLKAKIAEADTNAANDKAIEAERLKKVTAEVRANANAYLSQIGSIDEARAAIKLLTLERDKENANTEEGKARIAELNAEINRNNEFIRENVSKLEQQKINIGNYPKVVEVLKTSITELAVEMSRMATAGNEDSEAFQQLVLEQKLLAQSLERQEKGFGNVNAQMRSVKNTLDAMAIAGLEGTEAFEQLNKVYTESEQKIKDLHREQAILTSEMPALTALTAVARGLGGAYAISAGAAALLANGDEKVEKELNKLVAVMTLLQGLEEAANVIKDRGALLTAIQTTATKALNAVREIEIALFGQATAAATAETEAKIASTEANVGNAEASEAAAASAEVNAAAMEGVTVASEAATAATISLRTALISTGIGAIIIGLIYGVVKLVGAISDWAHADEKAVEQQKKLTESSKELNALLNELNEAYTVGYEKRVEEAEKASAAVKAAGKNQIEQLAEERKLLQERYDLARAQRAFDEGESDPETANEKRIAALQKLRGIEAALRRETLSVDPDKDATEKLEKEKAAAKAELDLATQTYQQGLKLDKAFQDARAALEENALAVSKALFDELQKITADAADRRYNAQKGANDRLLNDDRTSFQGRLEALSSNYGAEAALVAQQERAVEQRAARGIITEKEAADERANLQAGLLEKYRAYLEDRRKLTVEYEDREREARNSIAKSGNEADVVKEEAITKDIQKELEVRLAAFKQSVADKAAVIADDYTLQLTLAREHGKTESEIAALTAEKDKALVELTADTQRQLYEIVTSWGDRRLKALQEQAKAENTANAVSATYNEETAALDAALANRTITYEHYQERRKKLDRQFAIERDQAELRDDDQALKRLKAFEEAELKIKIDVAQRTLAAAKAGGDEDEIGRAQAKMDALLDVQKRAAAQENELTDKRNRDNAKLNADRIAATIEAENTLAGKLKQLRENSFNLAKDLVDAAYEHRIEQIQKEIDANDEQATAQIAAVQRSTLSQQQQAQEVIILQAQQKARDTQLKLEQKAEKQKEARFDRDMAVAKVVWDTERAVVKDLADNPFPLNLAIAAADAGLGAVAIATILAKPIPSYASGIGIPGKGTHPGGVALVGEAGPELVTDTNLPPTVIDRPTLLDLSPRAQVLPLDPDQLVVDLAGRLNTRAAERVGTEERAQPDVVTAIDRQTTRLERATRRAPVRVNVVVRAAPELRGIDPDYYRTKIEGRR